MKQLLLLLSLCILITCKTPQKLSIDHGDYLGDDIRMDGYYYYFDGNKFNDFFLFTNGVYYGGPGMGSITDLDSSPLDSMDEEIREYHLFRERHLPLQYEWGIFSIEELEIQIERWIPSSGNYGYPTQILEGKILNDTTILFHTQIGDGSGKKKVKNIDMIYHFRQFSPKPDSTNIYIK